MHRSRILLLAASLLALAERAPAAGDEAPSGKDLYETWCLRCHDTGRDGAPDLRKSLVVELDGFRTVVFKGKPGTTMEGFSESLKDADVEAIRQYLLDERR